MRGERKEGLVLDRRTLVEFATERGQSAGLIRALSRGRGKKLAARAIDFRGMTTNLEVLGEDIAAPRQLRAGLDTLGTAAGADEEPLDRLLDVVGREDLGAADG